MSLGMPVYNGADLLPRAVESLLSQTLGDFELILSDNGSGDGSAEMATTYAERDRRVRVVSHPVNRGASWNFAEVFRPATGKYFAWTAVDDYWDPRFLEACVAELESRPDAVCCVPETQPVSRAGTPVGKPYKGLAVEGADVRTRWCSALHNSFLHMAAYGVVRREALAATRLAPPYLGSDYVLMAELALQGAIVQIPEVLAYKLVPGEGEDYRSHAAMLQYLGGRRRAPLLLWLNMTKELVVAIRYVRPQGCSPARLAADTVVSYFSTGGVLNDARWTAQRIRAGSRRLSLTSGAR